MKVALTTYVAFGCCLSLGLACATERRSAASDTTSVKRADTLVGSQVQTRASSSARDEINSVAIKSPIPTLWQPAKEPQCPDSVDVFHCYALEVENPILTTTGPRVRRAGDTLRVNTNARTLTWIDSNMIGEGTARHFYEGTISARKGQKYAVVRHDLYEDNPYVLIDWVSGDTVSVPDRPVVSPDSNRIVVGAFSEDGRLELEVWNIGSGSPTREFAHEWDGAGPVAISWRGNSIIDFRLRQTSGGRESIPAPVPMVLMRERDSTWKLDSRR